jgi:large subunit ribosomal protein L21
VAGAKVEGTVLRHLRGRKVLVYKMKPKKKTRKKRGHRQEITRLLINSISLDGSVLASEDSAISLRPDAEVTEPVATGADNNETQQTIDVAAEPVATDETSEAAATPDADNPPAEETATE